MRRRSIGWMNSAGVAQWQSSSLPSWLCGFDSRHPLARTPVQAVCPTVEWFVSGLRRANDGYKAGYKASGQGGGLAVGVEHEALELVRHHFVAPLAVRADEAEVGHEHARFAGDVGAHVPGVGGLEQRRAEELGVVLDPRILGFLGGLDRGRAPVAYRGDDRADEVDVLLDGYGHVGQHRR